MAVEYQLPIQPVVTDGLHRVFPPGSLILKRRGKNPVRVRYLDPIEPPFGEDSRRRVVRELSQRARASMVEELSRIRLEGKSTGGG
jgi:1-acyl-sn-glycerol-3-phosphate acyltransferase